MVSQLMTHLKTSWDISKLHELFDQESIVAILKIHLWNKNKPDKWVWSNAAYECFSIKSTYQLSSNNGLNYSTYSLKSKIWKSHFYERLKILLWRIASNLLPTIDLTSSFGPWVELACPFCGMENETALHIFTKCHIVKVVWYGY